MRKTSSNLPLLLGLLFVLCSIVSTQDSVPSVDFQLCNEGCIKCSDNGKCEFCDIQKNYFLNNNTCVKITILNCSSYTFKGNCKECAVNYYLTESKCKIVDESNRVPNCLQHKSPGVCLQCEPTHILIQGDCNSIGTTIDKCKKYNSSGTLCKNCQEHVLEQNFKTCDQNFSTVANCKL